MAVDMLFLALFFFLFSLLVMVIAFGFMNGPFYRQFIKRYMNYFGINADKIPATEAVPDPLMPIVKQGKFAGCLLIFLSIMLFFTGVFMLWVGR